MVHELVDVGMIVAMLDTIETHERTSKHRDYYCNNAIIVEETGRSCHRRRALKDRWRDRLVEGVPVLSVRVP